MALWTEADRDLLRTLWARGESSGDIAGSLGRGITRNAVMGMVNRLGLMGLGHPDVVRLAMMDKVAEVMDMPFSLGEPLHREALLAFLVGTAGRDADRLSRASGIAKPQVSSFLLRLPMVWPERSSHMPARWLGSLEGVLAFILDMAVVAGRIDEVPLRRVAAVNEDEVPATVAA